MTDVEELQKEWRRFNNRAAIAHACAVDGIGQYVQKLAKDAAAFEARFPGMDYGGVLFGSGDDNPNDPETIHYAQADVRDLAVDVERDGRIALELGRQWLVSVYSMWEHHIREELKNATGEPWENPVLGDLGYLRHDILKHRGIAQAKNAGRCTVLRHWVEIGKEIRIHREEVSEYMTLMGLSGRMGDGPIGGRQRTPDWGR